MIGDIRLSADELAGYMLETDDESEDEEDVDEHEMQEMAQNIPCSGGKMRGAGR